MYFIMWYFQKISLFKRDFSYLFFSRGCGSGEVGVSEERLGTVGFFHHEGSQVKGSFWAQRCYIHIISEATHKMRTVGLGF